MKALIELAEKGRIPDAVIRFGIRLLLRKRLKSLRLTREEDGEDSVWKFVEKMRGQPIAIHTDDANSQHYEVPADFFRLVLGGRMKYSSALWNQETRSLEEAEDEMLKLVAERAQIENGLRVLDLGCGWGSFSLWAAKRYPESEFIAVSNSKEQAKVIREGAREIGLKNLVVETQDVKNLSLTEEFDRVVSIEMFEHMRNWGLLLGVLESHLKPNGSVFIHVFSHRESPYFFETEDDDDWMGREFFTGGMMPSYQLPFFLESPLSVERSWIVSGNHYAKTCRAWLKRLDSNREKVREIFEGCYLKQERLWLQRWRIFFMACEELFAFNSGREWMVSHYRFRRRLEMESQFEREDPRIASTPS
ncbi:MAG: class I SAM-dependent methyltransferase [Bradymonadales bacterium]|nr:MAG: class I SAM-dependent methyltransferase [Bradymonadales bacterium]